MKSHYYSQHAVALRAELGEAISRDQMRAFHQKSAARHLVIAARQFAILGLATVSTALALLGKRSHGAAVVLEGHRPVGIVAEKDCLEVDRFTPIRQVMTSEIVTVDKDTHLDSVFERLSTRHLGMVPVLDGEHLAPRPPFGWRPTLGRGRLFDLHPA